MLKQKAISGVKWTTLSVLVTAIFQILQLAILARFLDPSEFGLMALVMVVVGFSQAFLDMGISNAIIHKQEITKDQLSTLYWVNLLAGFALFIVISAISPLVANFYHEPELTMLIILVGATFLIQPFGQQFMVLCQKEMRFSEIAKIDIASKFISLTVSVYFAYEGYGIYALVYGTLVGVVVQTILFMHKGLQEYKPSFVFKLNEIKEFLSFGAYQMGDKTINYFNYQIDIILIGKLLDTEALGLYAIAKQLVIKPDQLFSPLVSKVAFPVMAKMQDDILKLKVVYLKLINYLSSIIFPIYLLMFIFSNEIILFAFGEAWMEVVPLLQVLSIWASFRSTGSPVGVLLMARGKAKLGFWWNVSLLFYIPIGIYIGSFFGILGVCYALVLLLFPIGIIANWYFLINPLCNAKFIEYHKNIFRSFSISLLTGIILVLVTNLIELALLKLIIGFIVWAIAILLLNYVFNKEFIYELKGIRSR